MVLTLGVALIPGTSERVFVPLALATWLIAGCWLAASFPDRAGATARRRRSALFGAATLFAAGAAPIFFSRSACAFFALFVVMWVLMSAPFFILIRIGIAQVGERIEMWRQVTETLGDASSLKGAYEATAREALALEQVARDSLAPEAREAFERFVEWIHGIQEDPTAHHPRPDVEMEEEEETEELRAYVATAGRTVALLQGGVVRSHTAPFEQLAPMADAIRSFDLGIRSLGPALLALGFILAWLIVYMLVWAVDPSAWVGVGVERAQFGDFVFLAVDGAFGGGGDVGIEAGTSATRMLVLAETVMGATVLVTYLRAVWGSDEAAPAETPGSDE